MNNASPIILANTEDFSQLDSVQEVFEQDINAQKLSAGFINQDEAPLIAMGSFNGMIINDQFDNQIRDVPPNLDTANKEAEHRRRALKSQGQSRPFAKNKRSNIKNVQRMAREGQPAGVGPDGPGDTNWHGQGAQNEGREDDDNGQEMTIHDIMSIDRVEQAGQKTQR